MNGCVHSLYKTRQKRKMNGVEELLTHSNTKKVEVEYKSVHELNTFTQYSK